MFGSKAREIKYLNAQIQVHENRVQEERSETRRVCHLLRQKNHEEMCAEEAQLDKKELERKLAIEHTTIKVFLKDGEHAMVTCQTVHKSGNELVLINHLDDGNTDCRGCFNLNEIIGWEDMG